MRSIWLMLLFMFVTDWIMRFHWNYIFNSATMKGLLKLPGHEQLDIVKRCRAEHPNLILRRLAQMVREHDNKTTGARSTSCQQTRDSTSFLSSHSIPQNGDLGAVSTYIRITENNEHNLIMNYYVEQFTYVLMSKSSSGYKLTDLKLRRKFILYLLVSLIVTMSHFLVPLICIGPAYLDYGLQVAGVWSSYLINASWSKPENTINSVDYKISSRIWPTSTQCQYMDFGYQGYESTIVQCTIPINEISGKFFIAIWFYTIINIAVVAYRFTTMLVILMNFKLTSKAFGAFYWPGARAEADALVGFRYRYARLLERLNHQHGVYPRQLGQSPQSTCSNSPAMSAREQKRHEANDLASCNGSRFSSSRNCGLFCFGHHILREHPDKVVCSLHNNQISLIGLPQPRRSAPDPNGIMEKRDDMNMYILFYLLYCRLKCSRVRMEFILKETHRVLYEYLDTLEAALELHSLPSNALPPVQREPGVSESTTQHEENNPHITDSNIDNSNMTFSNLANCMERLPVQMISSTANKIPTDETGAGNPQSA